MSYQKNGDDNGRTEGTMESLTTEHIVGKSEYFKKDLSATDKYVDDKLDWNTQLNEEFFPQNDTKEIIEEITEHGND